MNTNLKPHDVQVHKLPSGYAVSGVFTKDGKDILARCLYSDTTLYDDWHSENEDAHDYALSIATAIITNEYDRLASGKLYPGEAYGEY